MNFDDAACRDNDTMPPDAWFSHEDHKGGLSWEMMRAIDICNTCPIQAECAEYGITHDEAGVWGGLTVKQRKQAAHNRGIVQIKPPPIERAPAATCGTESGHKAHRRRGEPACESCRLAANAAKWQRKQRARGAA